MTKLTSNCWSIVNKNSLCLLVIDQNNIPFVIPDPCDVKINLLNYVKFIKSSLETNLIGSQTFSVLCYNSNIEFTGISNEEKAQQKQISDLAQGLKLKVLNFQDVEKTDKIEPIKPTFMKSPIFSKAPDHIKKLNSNDKNVAFYSSFYNFSGKEEIKQNQIMDIFGSICDNKEDLLKDFKNHSKQENLTKIRTFYKVSDKNGQMLSVLSSFLEQDAILEKIQDEIETFLEYFDDKLNIELLLFNKNLNFDKIKQLSSNKPEKINFVLVFIIGLIISTIILYLFQNRAKF